MLKAKGYCKYIVKNSTPPLDFGPKNETLVNWNKAFLGQIKALREEGHFTSAYKGEALAWAHSLVGNSSTASIGHVIPDRHQAHRVLSAMQRITGPSGLFLDSSGALYKTKEVKQHGRELTPDGRGWL